MVYAEWQVDLFVSAIKIHDVIIGAKARIDALSKTNISQPLPPCNVSALAPPRRTSLPAFPMQPVDPSAAANNIRTAAGNDEIIAVAAG